MDKFRGAVIYLKVELDCEMPLTEDEWEGIANHTLAKIEDVTDSGYIHPGSRISRTSSISHVVVTDEQDRHTNRWLYRD